MERAIKVIMWVAFIVVAMTLEEIRVEYNIPITVIDLIFSPCALIICYFLIKWLVFKRNIEPYFTTITTKKLLLNFCMLTLLALPLGIWSTMAGISAPFEYYTSMKGAAHGYTLASIGFLLLNSWLCLCWKVYKQLTS